tara:strand:+ start:2510 stop:3673 length:1164 start_codon:yes stop_codon:yes gene_type:complete
MPKYNWNYPTKIWIGENSIQDLALACKNLNLKKPLIVTDKSLVNLKIFKHTTEVLKKKNFSFEIFSDVVGNPSGTNVNDGVKFFKINNCDGVIAFGGGSSLDVGKAVAFMSGQTFPIWEFEDVGNNWTKANSDKIAPIIAIPTTAGTGSETGRASVILNEETREKKIIFHPKFLPSIVILDPILTVGLPPEITATTGMDALAHNLEAFCAHGYHPMADGIALEGIGLIDQFLIEAYKNGSNINARMNMLSAASMGSTAFQKGLGAIHSLSHPINALNNIHHGLSNAIFMPYVLTFNKSEIKEKVFKVSSYLQLKDKSFDGFINWILKLRKKLNIPHKLSDIINQKDLDLDRLSKMAVEDPSTMTNPKKLTVSDMKSMYQNSISGDLF